MTRLYSTQSALIIRVVGNLGTGRESTVGVFCFSGRPCDCKLLLFRESPFNRPKLTGTNYVGYNTGFTCTKTKCKSVAINPVYRTRSNYLNILIIRTAYIIILFLSNSLNMNFSLGPRPHPYTGKRVWCTSSDFLGLMTWQF